MGIWKKKKKILGPQESTLGLISIWLTLSCSWLEFGSQDTFSQFPFLMFLDLCCRIVGNTESGESAKKDFSPSQEGLGSCLRHQSVGCLLSAFLFSSRWAQPGGLCIHIGRRAFSFLGFEELPSYSPVSTPPISEPAWSRSDLWAPGLLRTNRELVN